MSYCVYKITNTVNNMLYIGVTTGSLRSRWGQHIHAALAGNPKPLYCAMRELGIALFMLEPVEELPDERTMYARESTLIQVLHTSYPQGYNVRTPLTDEQAAIVKYNVYGLTQKQYAELFGKSLSTINRIRMHPPFNTYQHITMEHLPK
jgi:GIY-YIG catalytic domain